MELPKSIRKTFFVDTGNRCGQKGNKITMPDHPYEHQLNREEYVKAGQKFLSKMSPSISLKTMAAQSTSNSTSTSTDATGIYYSGTACDYSGQSEENKGKMNDLQSDLNVLNAKVNADFIVAMNEVVQKGFTVFPDSGARYDRLSGSSEEDIRRKNTYYVWRGAFENAQAAMNSFYTIGNEHTTEFQSWKGGRNFNESFIDTILRLFLTGTSEEIIASIVGKFRDAQTGDMGVAQEVNEIDYYNTLLITVIYVDASGTLQATNSVTEYYMSQRDTQKLDCKNTQAEGTVEYSFQGFMTRVNTDLLREQVGNNYGAIHAGNVFFTELSNAGQGNIDADDNSTPNFFD